jgi:hypothetical protein
LVFSWLAPQIFDVPLGYERDMQWLVLFVTVAFLTTAFASSFSFPLTPIIALTCASW